MIESEVIREVNHPVWPLVWQIYGESFPRYEQRQSQHQPQKMRDPRYHCQIFYQDGLLLGFIFWWACGEQIYIEHLAINPALRGATMAAACWPNFASGQVKPSFSRSIRQRMRLLFAVCASIRGWVFVSTTMPMSTRPIIRTIKVMRYGC